jgi:Putative auto-transporter adhesin, head GIN domain
MFTRSLKCSRLAVILLLTAIPLLASGCGISVSRDGPHRVRSRNVAPFSEIEVHGSTEVTVRTGPRESLEVEGGADRIAELTTTVRDGALSVERDDSSATMTSTTILRRSPSSVFTARASPRRSMARAKSGRQGQVRRLRSQIDGSGNLDLGALQVEAGKVEISGSGSAQVDPDRRLDADIDGSGEVDYLGHPTVSESISGSGRVVGQGR